MTLYSLYKELRPYVRPYRWLVYLALFLTLVGSLTAQVNAWVLRYTVDAINGLVETHQGLESGYRILTLISLILIGKELINIFVQFGQKFFWRKAADLPLSGPGPDGDTRLVQNFFIDILPLLASAVVALLMMFNANFYVGLVGFLIVPVYYAVSRVQALKLMGARRLIKELRENKSQGILSILESIPVIKSFLREDIEKDKQMALQNNLTNTQMKIRSTSFFFEGLKSFVEQIGVVAIIILTTYFVLTDRMTIGAIMFHILLYNNVTAPIRQLHRLYDQMNDALIYSEGFFELLKADEHLEKSGSYRPQSIVGTFNLEKVYFTYPGNERPTLFDVNMTIPAGKVTALVGLSGAGKSTLINLLDKFYLPDSGSLSLDGVSLTDYDTDFLRANIGLVLQKNHIFNGTVEENIRYGKLQASREEMEEAARKAFLHDQIMALPNGYATSALALSGGQQQKIAITRMFLKNPPIILWTNPQPAWTP